MSEETRESLSALIDGEVAMDQAAQLIDRVVEDPSLRAAWRRYHLVSDVLHNTLSDLGANDLQERVRQSIDAEAITFPRHRELPSFIKPVAGLALAASVAVVAIIGFRNMEQEVVPSPQRVAESRDDDRRRERVPMRWNVDAPAVEERLNSYLVDHSEYLDNGMRGMLPYARIVGYDASK